MAQCPWARAGWRRRRRCRAPGAASTLSIVSEKSRSLKCALLAPKNNITCLPIERLTNRDRSFILMTWKLSRDVNVKKKEVFSPCAPAFAKIRLQINVLVEKMKWM